MATTKNKPLAICLDLTRLISRVGKGQHTGIDRVELAYLHRLLGSCKPLYLLIKIRKQYLILDQLGAREIYERLEGRSAWGPVKGLDRYRRKIPKTARQAQSDVRRFAVNETGPAGLSDALALLLPEGGAYLNVGHSNLSNVTLSQISKVSGVETIVMVHDVIPLSHPEFQKPGYSESFKNKIECVAQHADQIIYVSEFSRRTCEQFLDERGWRKPEATVAHLGIDTAQTTAADLPAEALAGQQYFVVVGTIEPRKNHALLLDIWQNLSAEGHPAKLFVVGARGWNNDEVFKRLDARPPNVVELNNLSDSALSALITNSRGMLFPSKIEGFGLPPAEAAALGVPVVCGNLDVYREFLGDYPVYADTSDMYLWETTIKRLADSSTFEDNRQGQRQGKMDLPTWNSHFNLVLMMT